MDIPYTVELRRDTGLTNGKIGIWLFLASEVMLFGALFASYILIRTGAPSWPRGDTILNVPLATFNTIVLIGSSVTMVMAWASLMRGRFGTFRLYMGATILLGFVFLVVKYFEYSHKFHDGLFPSTNNFLAIYFTLTGLHMLHVAGGMAVNAYFWGPGAKLWKTNPVWFTNRVEHSGLFWHFVDLVWIFLFPDAVPSVGGSHERPRSRRRCDERPPRRRHRPTRQDLHHRLRRADGPDHRDGGDLPHPPAGADGGGRGACSSRPSRDRWWRATSCT